MSVPRVRLGDERHREAVAGAEQAQIIAWEGVTSKGLAGRLRRSRRTETVSTPMGLQPAPAAAGVSSGAPGAPSASLSASLSARACSICSAIPTMEFSSASKARRVGRFTDADSASAARAMAARSRIRSGSWKSRCIRPNETSIKTPCSMAASALRDGSVARRTEGASPKNSPRDASAKPGGTTIAAGRLPALTALSASSSLRTVSTATLRCASRRASRSREASLASRSTPRTRISAAPPSRGPAKT